MVVVAVIKEELKQEVVVVASSKRRRGRKRSQKERKKKKLSRTKSKTHHFHFQLKTWQEITRQCYNKSPFSPCYYIILLRDFLATFGFNIQELGNWLQAELD